MHHTIRTAVRRVLIPLLTLVALVSMTGRAVADDGRLSLLIIDGRNNHDWRATTDALRATLTATGRFDVTVSTAPEEKFIRTMPREPKDADAPMKAAYTEAMQAYEAAKRAAQRELGEPWQAWRPKFADYDAVVLNYNGPSWPDAVKADFEKYVAGGGGVVLIHAANNGFADWPEFNAMIGLGYNGDRGAPDGQCTKVDADGKVYTCCAGTNSGHGSIHPYVVDVRAADHPIMRGMPARWRHGRDELYHNLRGPAKNMTVLASAFSDPRTRGTGHHEPILYAVDHGKGRILVTTMGHLWPRQEFRDSLYCIGFQTVLARSAEFVATGEVTLDVPAAFPGADDVSLAPPSAVAWSASGQPLAAAPSETTDWRKVKEQNPYAMLTPAQERETFVLPEGYVAELVAAEPMVQEPVLAVFDGSGAMYVAEMRSYMQDEVGTGTKSLRNGRVKRLVDTDGDGRMDKATVFVDGLNLPRMILPLDDRIAVVETDHTAVWSYRDTDGDGVADEKTLLFEGRPGNETTSVEHQNSGLIWNIDNHIYTSYNHERYRFTDGQWKAESQPGHWAQWGLTRDDYGRIFYSSNSDPVLSIQVPRVYWGHISRKVGKTPRFMPSVGAPFEPEFLRARNLCPQQDKGPSLDEVPNTRLFTSLCGQSVYRGDAMPLELYGNYFVCDPTIHVVRRAVISDVGGKLMMHNPYGEGEFLNSPDFNFRPVNTSTGPDGCLYVVDMYRGIIQDAPWFGESSQKYAVDTGFVNNRQAGRIWRIRHVDHHPERAPDMLGESTAQLVRHFESPNGWRRDTAQKLIVLRDDRESVVPLLEGLVRFDLYAPLVRLHALWTLEGIGPVSDAVLIDALKDRDPHVRAAAIRIAEPHIKAGDEAWLTRLAALVEDKDPDVVKQLILSLGYSDHAIAKKAIDTAARKHLTHAGVFLATMASMWDEHTPLVDAMKSGEAFASIGDAQLRADTTARWVEGITMWKRQDLQLPAEMTAKEKWLISNGEKIYFETCFSCHGPNGKGQPVPGTDLTLAPPLVGSPRVLGDPARLLAILEHGLVGPVNGKTYAAGVMPPIATLGYTDHNRVTQVANFIRYAWGHELPPMDTGRVLEVRQRFAGRKGPWTLEELDKAMTAKEPGQ